MTQNSDPLSKTIPILPNVNTPFPRLHRQNSVHFNIEPIILNNSTQPTQGTNQIIQITPQQLVNIVRQIISQSTQQSTNATTTYYIKAASTKTPSLVARRNTQLMYPYLGGSVPMQQSLRPFDGTDPTYKTEEFLKAITSNMLMKAGPEQTDSPFHEAWILKRIAMIKTALKGPAKQLYSHLPLDIRKNWQAFCREFQKHLTINNCKHTKFLLESIARASGEQIKTLALRIEQMTRKAYLNNAPDMRNAQMNDALVKALDPQLARIAHKKIANHKSTELEPQLHNFHLHNLLKKYTKKTLQEHILIDTN